jgi:multidrug efflux system outer membrane protein
MRRLLTGSLALLCALLATPAVGQTPAAAAPPAQPIRQVDFDAAVKQAIERNPSVAAAATSIDRAEALLQGTRSAIRPTVSGSIASTTLNSSRGFEGTVTQPQTQATFGVTAAVPVLAPSRWASVNQAKDQVEVSRFSAAEVQQQIGVAAAQAYLSVIAVKRQVEVNEQALESARAHLDYAQKRLEGGAGSRLNQLRAAQEVSSGELRIENTRLLLRRAQEALGVLMAENGPVDTSGEPNLETAANIDEAAWMAARPDLRTQNAAIRANERVVGDSRFDWYPNATAAFTPVYVAPAGLFQPSRGWAFTVQFAQPIFDAGSRRSQTALRNVALSQSKFQLTSLELQARSDVRFAQETIASAERALTTARLASQQANEVLRITTSAFQVGATTNIEVIDAQRSAQDAETSAAIAQDELSRARLNLLVALGRFPR